MKRGLVIISALLILGLLLGSVSCAAPTATPTSAPAATTTAPATPTTPAKKYKLNYNIGTAPTHAKARATVITAADIEKLSNGRLHIEIYYGESLGKSNENYFLVEKGTVDIGGLVAGYVPGRFPFQEVWGLPFSWPSAEVATKVHIDLNLKGWYDKEYDGVKLLCGNSLSPYDAFTTVKISNVAEFKGKKLREAGGTWTQVYKILGIAGVAATSAEAYDLIQKRIVDGSFSPAGGMPYQGKYWEICDYVIKVGMGNTDIMDFINKDKWNELPSDLQKILSEEWPKGSMRSGKNYDLLGVETYDNFIKSKKEIVTFTDAEQTKLLKTVEPVIYTYYNDLKAKGLPVKEYMNEFVTLAKKYGCVWPEYKFD